MGNVQFVTAEAAAKHKRNVRTLGITSAIGTFGNSLWYFLLPLYLLLYGANLTLLGEVYSAFACASVVGAFVGGVISDYWNVKLTLVLSGLIAGTLLILAGTTRELTIVLLCLISYVIPLRISAQARFVLIARSSEPQNRPLAYATWQTFAEIGAFIGPIFSGLLLTDRMFQSAFVVAGFLLILVSVMRSLLIFNLESSRKVKLNMREALLGIRDIPLNSEIGVIVLVLFATSLLGTVSSFLVSPFSYRALGLSPTLIGYMFSLQLLIGAIILIPGERIANRIGIRRGALWFLMASSFLEIAFASLAYSTYPSIYLVISIFVSSQAFAVMATPLFSAWLYEAAPHGTGGRVYGTLESMVYLGGIVGPLIGARLFSLQESLPFFLEGAISVIILLFATRYFRHHAKDAACQY
ncbi:MAG: MFS transporter [Thermoplasmata archaeon]|nr:MFS transporter [Candidatus Sysuiplasma acidicola]MBX8645893.1 MFS transporter [Candidatus Sysuiplasma acidicola]